MQIVGILFSLFFMGVFGVSTPVETGELSSPAETLPIAEPMPLPEAVSADATTTELAMCINNNGAKFYGAFWCPHCNDQKEKFGDAIQYIDYIECDARGENGQPELCTQLKIESYPTWIFADGTRLVGSQEVEDLARQAACL